MRPFFCILETPQRVGNVVNNLSKVKENRLTLLQELVSVARSLGSVSTKDLQSLGQQLEVVKTEAVARVSGFSVESECLDPFSGTLLLYSSSHVFSRVNLTLLLKRVFFPCFMHFFSHLEKRMAR